VDTGEFEAGSRSSIDGASLVRDQHALAVASHDGQIRRVEQAIIASVAGGRWPATPGADAPADLHPPPAPLWLAPRASLVTRLASSAQEHGWIALCGGSGSGKSELARLVSASTGRHVFWLRLRDLSLSEAQVRHWMAVSELCAGTLGSDRRTWYARIVERYGPCLWVLDDVPRIDAPSQFSDELLYLLQAAAQGDSLRVLTTGNAPPTIVLLNYIDPNAVEVVHAPGFTANDVGDLLETMDAPPVSRKQPVYRAVCDAAHGSPWLVVQLLRRWHDAQWEPPVNEFLLAEAASVSAEVVKRVAATVVDQWPRELLYRVSELIGSFDLHLASAVAAVPPEIGEVSRHLEALVGLWIQRDTTNRFQVSPLVRGLADSELLPDVHKGVHAAAAGTILDSATVGPLAAAKAIRHLERAGQCERAALFLAWSLSQVPATVDEVEISARLLLSLWPRTWVPPDVDLGVRLFLLVEKLRVTSALGEPTAELESEVVQWADRADLEHTWALLAALVKASMIVGKRDLGAAGRMFLRAMSFIDSATVPHDGRLLKDIAPERLEAWIWHLTTLVSTVNDLRVWLGILEAMKPEHLAVAVKSPLYPAASPGERVWLAEEERAEDERDWLGIDDALRECVERCDRLDLRLLKAQTVRTRITVLAEKLGRLGDAVALSEDAVHNNPDPSVRFLINESIGRQYLYADKYDDARSRLALAAADGYRHMPILEIHALAALSQALVGSDGEAAIARLEQALKLCRRSAGIPVAEVIKVLGELAIAYWTVRGVASAFGHYHEAASLLMGARDDSDAWRGLCVVFGHLSGYLVSLASTGKPPAKTGDSQEYVAPAPGFFYRHRGRAASLYREQRLPALYFHVSEFAECAGDDENASQWAFDGLRLSDELQESGVESLLAARAGFLLIGSGRMNDGVLALLRASRASINTLIDNYRRGGLAPEFRDKGAALSSSEQDALLAIEYHAATMILLPASIAIAATMLESMSQASARASELVSALAQVKASAADRALWEGAVRIVNLTFIERTPGRALMAEPHAGGREETTRLLRALAFFGASLQDDVGLQQAVVTHWEIMESIDSMPRKALDWYTSFVVRYWRKAFENGRHNFAAPRLVDEELAEAAQSSPDIRARTTLQAVAKGLRQKLPKAQQTTH